MRFAIVDNNDNVLIAWDNARLAREALASEASIVRFSSWLRSRARAKLEAALDQALLSMSKELRRL